VQLARRERVKMTLVLLVREGGTYRVVEGGFFDAPRTEDEDDDVRRGTQLWTRMLEAEIRKCPEQWTWMHNRWHSTPERPRRHLDRGRQME
jgi:lauroyl/myristoyl acyltransferase